MFSLRDAFRAMCVMVAVVYGQAVCAAEELALYVFSAGKPVAGVVVSAGDVNLGTTRADGGLLANLEGGQQVLALQSPDGTERSVRFSSGSGQLVDIIVDLDADAQPIVDVYSRSESSAERRDAASGIAEVYVVRGAEPVVGQLAVFSGGQGAVATNGQGVAAKQMPRGVYTVSVGDITQTIRVVGGVTRGIRLALPEQEGLAIERPTLEEVFVIASFDASGFEVSERDTSSIVDTIGVELLTRFGDSDVAASVTRVPGISVQDDKYVFIRGLGGRYVTSTLNNSTMPSTNPTKRTVPLDLFPSNFVSQLDIKKTFLPFMPGESTGGNLVINTKTFPDERGGGISASAGFVSDLTGNTVGVDPNSGAFDWLGWDDGARKENIVVQVVGDIIQDGGVFTDSESGETYQLSQPVLRELQRTAGILLANDWDLDFSDATPNAGVGVNYGDLFYFDESELGFYAAVNYSNSWSKRSNGIRRSYGASGNLADDRVYESYSNNIEISGLLSVGWNIGNTTIEWNNVASRSTESFVERQVGREGDEFRAIYEHTNQWEERQFVSSQLVGSHFLNEDGSLFGEWQLTASQAVRYVPGRTDVRFNAEANLTDPAELAAQYDFSKPNNEQTDILNGFFFSSGSSSKRWDELTDNNFDASFDITWDVFDSGSSFAQLRFGAQAIYRERDADSATYGFFNNGADATLSASPNVLVSDNIFVCGEGDGTVNCPLPPTEDGQILPPEGGVQNNATTGFLFQVRTQVSDEYDAELDYNSAYLMYDHTLNSTWQILLGARYEQYDQVTDTFDLTTGAAVQGIVDEGSLLPALGINWFYAEDQQLRLAVSQTVARPDFKEASNAVFFDNEFNVRVRGNPNLGISDIINADLRWEWYFGDNEQDSLSAALFYKDMTDPIERVVQPASGTAGNSRTFQNSQSAELYGFEVEGRKEFVLTSDYNHTVFVSFNAAYIESEVTLLNGTTRALQGQPEYTTNLVLGYDNLDGGHQVTLLMNYNGTSIADVGIFGAPDIYLEPRGEINLVYRWDITDTAALKARIENLLDAEVEYTQGDQLFQRYEKGTTFQVGFDWDF